MKIFGREPALWVAAIYAVLMTLATFHIPGVDGTMALLVQGVLLAAATAWTAYQVRPVAPAVFAGVVVELAALLAHFGLDLTETQVGSVQAALAVLVSLMVRGQVTPVADPSTQIVTK